MKFCSGLTAHQTVDEDITAATHSCSCITQEQHTVCLSAADGWNKQEGRRERTREPALLYVSVHTFILGWLLMTRLNLQFNMDALGCAVIPHPKASL